MSNCGVSTHYPTLPSGQEGWGTRLRGSSYVDDAVVVAVVSVLVMEVVADEVVHVVAVGNALVTAVLAVFVDAIVAAAIVARSATSRVGRAHGDAVFFHPAAILVMQASVM
jgi:hypothetical protein